LAYFDLKVRDLFKGEFVSHMACTHIYTGRQKVEYFLKDENLVSRRIRPQLSPREVSLKEQEHLEVGGLEVGPL